MKNTNELTSRYNIEKEFLLKTLCWLQLREKMFAYREWGGLGGGVGLCVFNFPFNTFSKRTVKSDIYLSLFLKLPLENFSSKKVVKRCMRETNHGFVVFISWLNHIRTFNFALKILSFDLFSYFLIVCISGSAYAAINLQNLYFIKQSWMKQN